MPPSQPPRCLALDLRSNQQCTQRVAVMPEAALSSPDSSDLAGFSKWCAYHEEAQGKQLKIYKHLTARFEAFESECASEGLATPPPVDVCHIMSEKDVRCLKRWHDLHRRNHFLCSRALKARTIHHLQFYRGGDDNHCLYLDFLSKELRTMEVAIDACDRRAYDLILEQQQASWIHNESRSATENACDDEPEPREEPPIKEVRSPRSPKTSKRRTSSASSNTSSGASDASSVYSDTTAASSVALVPDPHSEPECTRRNDLVDSLLSLFPTRPQPPECIACDTTFVVKVREYTDRHAIVSNLFRRIISRSPSLFVLAMCCTCDDHAEDGQAFHDVPSFISSELISLSDLEKLSKKMRFGRGGSIGPEMLRNAIVDVERDGSILRDELIAPGSIAPTKGRLHLLGGWLYQKPDEGAMSPRGWVFLHDYISCAGCALSVCRTFGEWVALRKQTVVDRTSGKCSSHSQGSLGPQLYRWTADNESHSERVFKALELSLCLQHPAARTVLAKFVPKLRGAKPVYNETEERHWAFFKLSVKHPHALKFIEALSSDEKFTAMVRNGETQEFLHDPTLSKSVWTSRIRSASSPMQRRVARWTVTMLFQTDAIERLVERGPETKFNRRWNDVWEILILDETASKWEEFLGRIATTMLEVSGQASAKEVCI